MKNRLEKGKTFPPGLAQSKQGVARRVSAAGRAPLPRSMGRVVVPGALGGPLGTAAVTASSLALCGKVSWATQAPSALCLYCNMLRRAIRAMHPSKHGVSAEQMSLVTRRAVLPGWA